MRQKKPTIKFIRLLLKVFCLLILFSLSRFVYPRENKNNFNPDNFVNPFIGTGGHGHTYPGAVVPFGMVQLSPDNGTAGWDWCSGYNYADSIIIGFSHTHLSGTGIGDLCDILFMPAVMQINSDGKWKNDFDPRYSNHRNDEYTEGDAWQWSRFVPQDVRGLISLTGGKERFTEKLDSLFSQSLVIEGSNASPDISGLTGQYAQGNEPSHHIAYLYNYAGKPWKTQQTVRRIMESILP